MDVPDEISKLVGNSGNKFHAIVARWFSAKGWHVVVSPYYMDQTQSKAREIDLIAEKLWPVPDTFDHHVGHVAVRLFIECKFVPSYSVFWFADKDRESARDLVCARGHFQPDNIYTEKHHYLAKGAKVAKLFATSVSKAQENEPFYKALNQALNAMTSMSDRPISIPSLKKKQESPLATIEFPVVVCSSFDQIYSVDFHSDSKPEPVVENFQLEVRYAYIDGRNNQRDDYFLLDFVEFSQLEKFSEVISEDAGTAAFFASPH